MKFKGRASVQSSLVHRFKEVHYRFCELLPDELLWIENPDTGERLKVVAGQLRDHDVRIGRHIPVSPGAAPRFLTHCEEIYGRLGKTDGFCRLRLRIIVCCGSSVP